MNPINKALYLKMHNINIIFSQIFFCLVFILSLAVSPSGAVSPPSQTLAGPGGADYTHNDITSNKYGEGDLEYYLFEPSSPRPDTAPLIVFLHGFGQTNPHTYGTWIEHIVKKGNIVVFPVYQSRFTSFKLLTYNAIQAVLNSLQELNSNNHVAPDLNKFALVGHSCGGILTSNMAALAAESGLPTPRAVMTVEPGRSSLFTLENLSKIPSHTLLLTVTGDQDYIAGDKDAKKIFLGSDQIPLENKDFIIMVSDQHGSTPLVADHSVPCGTPSKSGPTDFPTDTFDYFCLWKLFDALTDTAFYGVNSEYALGNTLQQRYMGEWSDGTPVNELIITDNP